MTTSHDFSHPAIHRLADWSVLASPAANGGAVSELGGITKELKDAEHLLITKDG